MNVWIPFWSILLKDMQSYYLKPPNISWGIVFPLAWTGIFFIRSGAGADSILSVLPLTYGADALHSSIRHAGAIPLALDFGLLVAFCAALFAMSLRNIKKK